MIDWKILNYLNKQKYKNILLIIKNYEEVEKYVINKNITILEEKNFLDYIPENTYHIISTWDILSEGSSLPIYTYLAKMNHYLRDDGFLYLRVLSGKTYLENFDTIPFCWNIDRIKSIGSAKALIQYGKEEYIKTKNNSFIRFKYVPSY